MTLSELLLQKNEIGSVADLRNKVSSDPDFKKSLEAIYSEMFGKELNRECPDCWNDAYLAIWSKMKSDNHFQLRAGAVLTDAENGVVYNQHSISDKYALKHLKQFPESIDLFAVVPSDLDERLEAL